MPATARHFISTKALTASGPSDMPAGTAQVSAPTVTLLALSAVIGPLTSASPCAPPCCPSSSLSTFTTVRTPATSLHFSSTRSLTANPVRLVPVGIAQVCAPTVMLVALSAVI